MSSSSASRYKDTGRVDLSDFGKSALAGGVAGFAVKTLTAPLSRMTILLQVSDSSSGGGAPSRSARGATAASGAAAAGGLSTGAQKSTGISTEIHKMNRTGGTNLEMSIKIGNSAAASSSSSVGIAANSLPSSSSSGSLGMLRKVAETEGLASFWKGNWTSIMHKGLLTGLNYGLFETMKSGLKPIWRSETDPGFLARTAAGFCASSISLTIAYPFDLMRTRLACEPKNYHLAVPSGQQWLSVYRDLVSCPSGHLALVRGLPCTLLCQGLNVGLNFGIYETLNVWLLRQNETRTSFLETMGCGAVAGITASSLVQPLDLIRRRQQMSTGVEAGRSVWGWVKKIFFERGMRGFYRGLVPELLKVAPAVGLNFYIYEWMRQEVFQSKVHPR